MLCVMLVICIQSVAESSAIANEEIRLRDAGGPGGSGIEAINYRYRMFMEMRKHGDVIALDQRGTGNRMWCPNVGRDKSAPL